MVRRALAVAALVGVLCGVQWGFAGEGKEKPAKKPKAEAVSTADYLKSIQELLAVAKELEGPDAAGKAQALRDRVKAAAANLRLSGPQVERMVAEQDNQALAGRLRSYAENSLRGKINAERRELIQAKPELKQEYDKFGEREQQLAKDKEEFYAKLRPLSPDLDSLEKLQETAEAEREQKRKEEAEAKRKAREGGKRAKEKNN